MGVLMRFPADTQLPPALVRGLTEEGHEAKHVIDCDLEAEDDSVI